MRTYRCWQSIRDRCLNEKSKSFSSYGGRGIRVCKRWRDSFENFLADMGEMPEGRSIGRVDNDGDYELGNCRWETREEQNNNTRQNVFVEWQGETKTVAQWARQLNVKEGSLRLRLGRGMSIDLAMNLSYDVSSTKNAVSKVKIEHAGESLTATEWSRRTGIGRTTILFRLNAGWPAKDILDARLDGRTRKRPP